MKTRLRPVDVEDLEAPVDAVWWQEDDDQLGGPVGVLVVRRWFRDRNLNQLELRFRRVSAHELIAWRRAVEAGA